MEQRLAVVEQGVVTNVIVVDPADAETIAHFGGLLLPENSSVAVGWAYDGAQFLEPQKAPIDVKAQIAEQIAQIERDTLMPRATREFMLAFMEASATPEQLAANIGYQKVKALDTELRALRAQL